MEKDPEEYGPWIDPKVDAGFARKSLPAGYQVLEVELWHDEKKSAGKGILYVLAKVPDERILECRVLAVEDPYYRWWVFESNETENPGLYRFASGGGTDRETKYKKGVVTPITRWRVLNAPNRVPDLVGVSWMTPKQKSRVVDSLAPDLAPLLPISTAGGMETPGKGGPGVGLPGGDAEVARALDDELNRPRQDRRGGVADDLRALEREVRGQAFPPLPGPLQGGADQELPRREEPPPKEPREGKVEKKPEDHESDPSDANRKKERFATKPHEKTSKKK